MKQDDDYNAIPGPGSSGKVHRVLALTDAAGVYYAPACNRGFNLGIDGWTTWTKTTRPVTCKHCLGIREEHNKVWRVTYTTVVKHDLHACFDKQSTREVHVVAHDRTQAALTFGHNMPKDCAHPTIELKQLSTEELLKERRML